MIYVYRCTRCEHSFEVTKSLSELARREPCPICGPVPETVRQLQAPGLDFSKGGSGFYANDYRRTKR